MKKKILKTSTIWLLSLVVVASCSRSIKKKLPSRSKKTSWKQGLSLRPIQVYPGKVVIVDFPFHQEIVPKLQCDNGNEFHLIKKDKMYKAYLVESYFSKLKPVNCFLTNGAESKQVLAISIKEFAYKSERLYVNKRRVELAPKDLARAIKEQKMLNAIYAAGSQTAYFDEAFQTPLKSKITSYYGARRVFNKKKKTQHLGTDYRARIGVPIKAVNRGKVVFSGNLFYTGNAVIIDHGLGIFTVYGHLSKLIAKKGELVVKNSLLGLSGNTGRVSGPHLHWGVKISGHWVDGISLVDQGI